MAKTVRKIKGKEVRDGQVPSRTRDIKFGLEPDREALAEGERILSELLKSKGAGR